jgi:hypothetical protein
MDKPATDEALKSQGSEKSGLVQQVLAVLHGSAGLFPVQRLLPMAVVY